VPRQSASAARRIFDAEKLLTPIARIFCADSSAAIASIWAFVLATAIGWCTW
jgi:hypothetical protein